MSEKRDPKKFPVDVLEPDFTIGMACFDNFDEVYFTVQALRFYHPELMKRFELIVVDNNPGSKDGRAVKALIDGRVRDRGRYIEFPHPKGSVPPRAHMIDQARGKFVICIDSHVFLAPGALAGLVKFFDENPDCDDFIQGPLLSNYGPHRVEGTHMNQRWRSAMFGTWGRDPRGDDPDGPPFEIPQHGLGMFAIRRASWLRFHPDFSGFSGGEGYIHEKYKQAGRKTICLPVARWYHKFSRPHGIPHKPTTEDKIRNHVRGWMELGVDLETRKTDDPIASIAKHYVGGERTSAARFSEIVAEAGFPGYVVKLDPEDLGGVVIGPHSWGSYQVRGRPVAHHLGWKELNTRAKIRLDSDEKFDVCLAVKSIAPPVVREQSKRMIFDPMDIWFDNRKEHAKTPAKFLADRFANFPFDELILATIPMKEGAKRGVPASVRTHLVPHHAEPRVGLDWFDPDGPIVYAGSRGFVSPAVSALTTAAKSIGREIVFDYDHHAWKSLKGASLVLAPRVGSAYRLNREGKPTIKIANASQAGIPCLATNCPAITSLFPDVRTAPASDWIDAKAIGGHLRKALDDEASAIKFTFEQWLQRMRGILCG
jgi:glycosyltransferase involved in cell wall biosynthesis